MLQFTNIKILIWIDVFVINNSLLFDYSENWLTRKRDYELERDRVDKINYYLDIAEAVAERGTCLRKNFGCIIVKNDEIIATRLYRSTKRKI